MTRLALVLFLSLAPVGGCTVHATVATPRTTARTTVRRPPRPRAARTTAPTVVVTPPAPARVIVRPR